MSENPLQFIFHTVDKISQCVQTHLAQFSGQPFNPLSSPTNKKPIFSLAESSNTGFQSKVILNKGNFSGPVTKEELGRATWTFLHTLGAQFPENPTRQQKKDVKELMAILSRMYPCKECADHFKEVLRANPVQAGSQADFSQWLCHVHNVVNRSLGKVVFPCERVDARWGKLDCEQHACNLQGIGTDFGQQTLK